MGSSTILNHHVSHQQGLMANSPAPPPINHSIFQASAVIPPPAKEVHVFHSAPAKEIHVIHSQPAKDIHVYTANTPSIYDRARSFMHLSSALSYTPHHISNTYYYSPPIYAYHPPPAEVYSYFGP